jgi:Methylase of chemotaxis methyl-accepting proteins
MLNLTNEDFEKLSNFTKSNYGLDLSHKRNIVEARLEGFLTRRGYTSFPHYFQILMNDRSGDEVSALLNRLTTNYTYFMREAEHFNYFRDKVLPHLAATEKNRDLRIWSAGCSSGEEPYTLAMIMNDYFGDAGPVWDKKILATDISSQVLETALRASYSEEQIRELPDKWKKKYFTKDQNGQNHVVPGIRNEVIFKKFNLMENNFPFKKKFHVIFCRNVMIYFDQDTKKRLINRMYDCMAPGGYFIIGHSESLNKQESGFRYVIPAIYRKE